MDTVTKEWLLNVLLEGNLPQIQQLKLLGVMRKNPSATIEQLREFLSRPTEKLVPNWDANYSKMICYGNIWSRMMPYRKAGDMYPGHKHDHHHVTLLAQGAVRVQVEGYEPREFHAPAWIIIPKEHEHQFIALEDDTVAFCIHAVRDQEGEVVEIYDASNMPALKPTGKRINVAIGEDTEFLKEA